ncbi:MAG TPA: hypothetical protein VKP01_07030 [Saliniramus sp.]|nr:hypothetical protein [Saliniramus sp.]
MAPHPDLGQRAPVMDDAPVFAMAPPAPPAPVGAETAVATDGADAGRGFAGFLAGIFGAGEAQAPGSWPYGTLTNATPVDCDRRVPRANHFHLFNAMDVPWKGCAESLPGSDRAFDGDRATLIDAAEGFMSCGLSGTNIAIGLVWAWRMQSQDFVPQARPYAPGHRKIVILMTDGFNDFVSQNNHWNRSDHAGTGCVARQRFGTRNRNQIMNTLDQRTTEVCERIKGRDIEPYTVLFDPQG